MYLEIELKLRIALQDYAVLINHPVLNAANTSRPFTEQLVSTYFDTPDQQLRQNGYALRIRESQGRFIQTVKSAGIHQDDLHYRHEWEYDIDTLKPDINLIEDNTLKNSLKNLIQGKRLVQFFKTEFERVTWEIKWTDGSIVEVVLDTGQVTTTKTTSPINEIELELKAGNVGRLYEIADSLKQTIPLTIENRSKAEQGYALYNQCN